jgi:hypothetical protein
MVRARNATGLAYDASVSSARRSRPWRWVAIALVVLLAAFSARYVSLTPEGRHRFDVAGGKRDLPLISPTLLGWILPGRHAQIQSAQFSPDGEWLYLSAGRGEGEQLASVTLSAPYPGRLEVGVRLISLPTAALGSPAYGVLFATRVPLDIWEYQGHPPITIDVGTGRPVVIETYVP